MRRPWKTWQSRPLESAQRIPSGRVGVGRAVAVLGEDGARSWATLVALVPIAIAISNEALEASRIHDTRVMQAGDSPRTIPRATPDRHRIASFFWWISHETGPGERPRLA
jgi:hypothetical protein